jgi:1,4-dihydroxy-2-naphthoate octaprenyltransferase
LALTIGIFFLYHWGLPILIFIFLLGFLGIFYSAPPFRFSYRGLGELLIGLVFGPLLMSGLYFASTGVVHSSVWFLSFPIGLLVSNILFTHDIMDFEADKKSGKKTLCVILGNQRINLVVSLLFIFIPYIIILSGVIFHFLSIWMLLLFVTLPQAVRLHYMLARFIKEPEREFSPVWWIQPMERWEEIKEAGIDWFMIRWYLARNLLVFFCLIIILGQHF